jgi:hypothetical protein
MVQHHLRGEVVDHQADSLGSIQVSGDGHQVARTGDRFLSPTSSTTPTMAVPGVNGARGWAGEAARASGAPDRSLSRWSYGC